MAKPTQAPDLYGSLGVQMPPAWSQSWMVMSHEHRNLCFADAAQRTFLTLNQMEQLLQGLPPETSSWPHSRCLMEEYVAAVSALRLAIALGDLANPVMPKQFVTWCEQHGWELPEQFVECVCDQSATPAHTQSVPISQTVGPSWAPLTVVSPKATKPTGKLKRGRPRTDMGHARALVDAGNEILWKAAESGVSMTREQVARALVGTSVAGGKSAATIVRTTSGQLQTEAASRRAAQVRKNGKGV